MTMFHNVEHTVACNGDVIALKGRTLKVMDLSDHATFDTNSGAPIGRYYQAWVDGYQNDGQSHNEAVWNALVTARKEQHKITYTGHALNGNPMDTPGNRHPEYRYEGYSGRPLSYKATVDEAKAHAEGVAAQGR